MASPKFQRMMMTAETLIELPSLKVEKPKEQIREYRTRRELTNYHLRVAKEDLQDSMVAISFTAGFNGFLLVLSLLQV